MSPTFTTRFGCGRLPPHWSLLELLQSNRYIRKFCGIRMIGVFFKRLLIAGLYGLIISVFGRGAQQFWGGVSQERYSRLREFESGW